MYFCRTENNKSTFQPEGAAPAASSLKSSYIKNEEKLSKERGTLKINGDFEKILDRFEANLWNFEVYTEDIREACQMIEKYYD